MTNQVITIFIKKLKIQENILKMQKRYILNNEALLFINVI
jgi:hypothetical protein